VRTAPDVGPARAGASPRWACAELLLAGAIIAAGLTVPHVVFSASSSPWLAAIGALLLWWRGPGWRQVGLGRPASLGRTVAISLLVGVGYQLFGTFALELVIARLTTGRLPDGSIFVSLIGDERQLAYWIAVSWLLAGLTEEVAFRGWIMTRLAEVGRFSTGAWVVAMLISSAVFGALHAYQGVSGMVANGFTGLVFAAVYLGTGRNLWAAIGTHGVLDTAGFVLIYLGLYPGITSG
jgi:membrane protease YdiL (CAAX protease family)